MDSLVLSVKIYTFFTGLGPIRIEENCALGLECTDRGRGPRTQFSSIRIAK